MNFDSADNNGALVCIGASWGGLHAVRDLLCDLPPDLRAPICIVLHRPEDHDETQLARMLGRDRRVKVCEPDDKQPLKPGVAYLAPAGYHLLIEDDHVSLSAEDRVRYARPSIDVLFESAAASRADRAIAVVLTGANDDGARGATAVHDAGGAVLVQDPGEAQRAEMPEATIAMTHPDAVLPLDSLAQEIVRRVREVVDL